MICVSDTHNYQPCLPPGDVLIHAGDLTQSGAFEELQAALDWLKQQPSTYKIVVTGNHDVLLDEMCDRIGNEEELRRRLDWGGLIHLQNDETTLKFDNGRSVRVWGSPMSPKNGNWAFQYPRSEDVWTEKIPDGNDVVVTHTPPRAHLDCTWAARTSLATCGG